MNSPSLTELFSAVVMISWRAGWLIVVLAALRLAVRGRVPAQVWFAAWIVVAVRLLLPFSFPTGWSPYNLTAAAVVPQPPSPMTSPTAETALPAVSIETAISLPPASTAPLPATADLAPPPVAAVAPTWSRAEIFAAMWIAGVAVLALARLAGSWNFRRKLREARPVADGRVAALVAGELAQAGRGAQFEVWETGAVDAPALYGLLRPRLLLPPGLAEKLTDDELRHVVRHELGHWRRRDLLAQALMQAAVALHWFNPLAWLAARLARTDCELACDEFVLRREAPGGAGAYGATLLKVLGVLRGRRRPAAVVAMLEGKEQLTQRIRMIAGYRASTVGRVMAGVLLIAVLAAASLTRESRAEQKTAVPATKADSGRAQKPSAENVQSGPIVSDRAVAVVPPSGNTVPPITTATTTKIGTGTLTLGSNTPSPSDTWPAATPYFGPTTISAGTLDLSSTASAGNNETPAATEADRRARMDKAVKAWEALRPLVEEQRRKVEQFQQMLQSYKEKNGAASFDSRRDLVNEKLKLLNLEFVRVSQLLNTAETRLQQVKERQEKGGDLSELPFIAAQPVVTQLTARRAEQQVVVETLNQRYGAKHPKMIEARNTLAQLERELHKAINTACAQVEAEYQASVRQNDQVKAELAKQNEAVLTLERLGQDYTRLERELKANEALLQKVAGRELETILSQAGEIRTPAAVDSRPVDLASQNEIASASREFTVSVIGAVNQQGGIRVSEQDKSITLDAIARAGGFGPRADRNAVRVIRLNPDGSRRTHTLTETEIMSGADPMGVLQRGDIVVVPEAPAPGQVFVVGQVNSPGQVSMHGGNKLTVIEAISKAHGPTRLANMKKVVLKRTKPDGTMEVQTVNVDDLMKTDARETFPLRPGDVITVPERTL